MHQRSAGAERRAAERTVSGRLGGLIDFYQSREWKALRDRVRLEEPLCRVCGRLTNHVDHVIPRKDGGTDTRDNLQGLCQECHNRKTTVERQR